MIKKEAYLATVHPGITVEDVKKEVSWKLKVAPDVNTTPVPTKGQVEIIRILDELKIYTGAGLKQLNFESYITMLENSHDKLNAMLQGN